MPERMASGQETYYRLLQWGNGREASERLAARLLLLERYTGVDPSHPRGGPDGRADILCRKGNRDWVGGVYFPNGEKSYTAVAKKFGEDLEGIDRNSADGIVFVTNQSVTRSNRKKLEEKVTELYADTTVEIYHLERICAILDSPSGYPLRQDFLGIKMNEAEQVAFYNHLEWTKYEKSMSYDDGDFRVDMKMKDDLESYTKEKREAIASRLRQLLGLPDNPDIDLRSGSVVLSVKDLTEDQAMRLQTAVEMGQFRDLGVLGETVRQVLPAGVRTRHPIIDELDRIGVEPDQRLSHALQLLPRYEAVTDDHLFHHLHSLNSYIARKIEISPSMLAGPAAQGRSVDLSAKTGGGWHFSDILNHALLHRTAHNTLGIGDVLRSWSQIALETGDDYTERPFTIDLLVQAKGHRPQTPLSEVPETSAILKELADSKPEPEDFQYILTVEKGRVAFRVVSTLGDYVQASDLGILTPQRALLTHFRDQFGGFTEDEILELETLLNDPKAKEAQFQDLFERYPHFLRRWDYREVHPHVYLAREDAGPLIPDFILTNRELQDAAIVDLRLPQPQLIRRQHRRDRFSAAVMQARSQLLTYRDWFRLKENRTRLVAQLGMEIYEPRLMVIVGRSSEFKDEFDRQRLVADVPGIEVVTYDDIVALAKQRKIVIQGPTESG